LLAPGLFATDVFANMGALYAVGSLLAFMFAHASILGLRVKKPDLPRPFKLGWNITIKGYELPISAIIGLLSTSVIWLIILFTEEYSRWVGLGWMFLGLVIYYFIRRRRRTPSEEWQVRKGEIK
jgi:APA family basic amino acid/polyamine antiporter